MLDQPMAYVTVGDRAKARAFYEGVLGLTFVSEDGHTLMLRSGSLLVCLIVSGQHTASDHPVFGWRVSNITPEVRALAEKGVRFERYSYFGDAQDSDGVWTADDGDKVAWFKDPSGNVLSLSQYVSFA